MLTQNAANLDDGDSCNGLLGSRGNSRENVFDVDGNLPYGALSQSSPKGKQSNVEELEALGIGSTLKSETHKKNLASLSNTTNVVQGARVQTSRT